MSILSQQKQSQNTDFPNIRPSLDLRFALAKKLDPRITFTRGSTGTYFGPDGLMRTAGVNEPRFDHDPITGQSLGLLIEESRTNLLFRSAQFGDTTYWTRPNFFGVNVDNDVITAPDGTQTAEYVYNTGTLVSLLQQNLTVSASSTNDYYATVYAKRGTASSFVFNCYYSGNTEDNVRFNFDTGSVTAVPNAGEYIFQNAGNGWYRCGFRISRDSTGTRTTLLFRLWPGGVRGSNAVGGTYFWGAQMELGAFPTSYIPTVLSTVTRSADNASMTGTNFSSWYNQSEGTLYAAAAPSTNAAYSGWIYLLGTDFNNGINFYRQSDYQPVIRIRSGQRDEYNKVSGAVGFGQIWRNAITLKSAFGFKTNDFNSCVAGTFSNISRGVSGTLPTFTGPLYLGGLNDGSQKLNGTISRLTYYPIRITDQQLRNLTS